MSSAAKPLPLSLINHLPFDDRRLVSPLAPPRRARPMSIPHCPGSMAVGGAELEQQLRLLENKLANDTESLWINEWLSHSSLAQQA